MGIRACKRQPFAPASIMGMLISMVLVMGYHASAAAATDFMVKISRLEEALDLIDSMGVSDTQKTPATAHREMLEGADWIDDERSLVLSWVNADERPFYAILVPFGRVNSDFKAAHDALARSNYYLLSLPPGRADAISKHLEHKMAEASQEVPAETVSLHLAPHRLVAGNIQASDPMPQTVSSGAPQDFGGSLLPAAEEIRHMAAALNVAAEQIDSLHVRADLNDNHVSIRIEMLPVKGSKLSEFLVSGGLTTRLDDYRPAHDISFRTRKFDVDTALDLLDTFLGANHENSGINIAELAAIGRYFTGETAGGITHADVEKHRVRVECMAVLKNHVETENFMEDVFLTWAEANVGNMAGFIQNPSESRNGSVVMRMPGSTVAGQRVAGLRVKIHETPTGKGRQDGEDKVTLYAFRLAVVGNLMLVAPDDARMKEMIFSVKHLRKKTSHGPMLAMTVDAGKYLSCLVPFFQGGSMDTPSLQHGHEGSWVFMAGNGRIISNAELEAGDLGMTLAALHRKPSATAGKKQASNRSEQRSASASKTDKPVPEPVTQTLALAPGATGSDPAPKKQSPASAPTPTRLLPAPMKPAPVLATGVDKSASVPMEKRAESAPSTGESVPSTGEQVAISSPESNTSEPVSVEQEKALSTKAIEVEPAPLVQAPAPASRSSDPVSAPMEQAPASVPRAGKPVAVPMKQASASAAKKEIAASKPAKHVSASAPKETKPKKKTAQPVTRDAGYWMEKGRLAAAYGAYESAIRYYQKALAMGTNKSRVFFNTGIAYGELGDYSRALENLKRAIQMDPGQGAYYYGRARVHLLAGNRHTAGEDFKRAAALGNLDAIQYLERAGQ